ncbi:FAD-dependent oxidoreductase [Adhaeribacter aerolatus]|uniref:FAD-dependent oxidoreductase n=1 Tax=Adhaeribacter aerolatus TaxID=670289 RepID=A0A512AVT4_9BACT|nr:FAD-dependent oxidoreductase [Adhaeribacter aerolatus]GEO03824.1 FAD-dependent oxidoreductase [Adhaeribacter aerolatus]
MIYDFILVGHGLAGSILAHTLAAHQYSVLVIDQVKPNSASNVAAGLMNPLAGKRFAKSWLADVLVPFATEFYQKLEEDRKVKLFYPKPILKLFSSVEEQNNWMGKSAGQPYGDFIQAVYTSLPPSEIIRQEQGGILIDKGGYVEVALLLETLRQIRQERDEIINEQFDFTFLTVESDSVHYKGWQARNIIFCEGFQGAENPYFKWLPFSLNKGEVLALKPAIPVPTDQVYNKGVYVLPKEDGSLRIGATYNWRNVDEQPTVAGKEELFGKIEDILKVPFTVLEHKAGIRPAVRDRRPLIGTHPNQERIKIFNGMGSKGVMMAPYLAHHFVQVLSGAEDLLPEINIFRYITLYREHY